VTAECPLASSGAHRSSDSAPPSHAILAFQLQIGTHLGSCSPRRIRNHLANPLFVLHEHPCAWTGRSIEVSTFDSRGHQVEEGREQRLSAWCERIFSSRLCNPRYRNCQSRERLLGAICSAISPGAYSFRCVSVQFLERLLFWASRLSRYCPTLVDRLEL
jgi:hypothetical protein